MGHCTEASLWTLLAKKINVVVRMKISMWFSHGWPLLPKMFMSWPNGSNCPVSINQWTPFIFSSWTIILDYIITWIKQSLSCMQHIIWLLLWLIYHGLITQKLESKSKFNIISHSWKNCFKILSLRWYQSLIQNIIHVLLVLYFFIKFFSLKRSLDNEKVTLEENSQLKTNFKNIK